MELVNVIKTPGPGVATVNAEVIRNKENKEVFDMQVNLTKYDYFCKEKYNMGYFEFIDKQRTQAKLKNMSKEAKEALKDLTAIADKYCLDDEE